MKRDEEQRTSDDHSCGCGIEGHEPYCEVYGREVSETPLPRCGDVCSIDNDPCKRPKGHDGPHEWRSPSLVLKHEADRLLETALLLHSMSGEPVRPTATAVSERVPWCEEHSPSKGGTFGSCLACECRELTRALSEIDAALDPNHDPMQGSYFETDYNPAGVVDRVRRHLRGEFFPCPRRESPEPQTADLQCVYCGNPYGHGHSNRCSVTKFRVPEQWWTAPCARVEESCGNASADTAVAARFDGLATSTRIEDSASLASSTSVPAGTADGALANASPTSASSLSASSETPPASSSDVHSSRVADPRDEDGVHHLKTWPDPFLAVWGGEKPFEWRKNDRGFKEGDALVLHEWEPTTGTETGRMLHAEVGYILRAPAFGIPEGYCVFALRDVEDATPCDACEIEQADAFPPPDREHVCCRRTAKATAPKDGG